MRAVGQAWLEVAQHLVDQQEVVNRAAELRPADSEGFGLPAAWLQELEFGLVEQSVSRRKLSSAGTAGEQRHSVGA